jgi:hypothetical protein
MVVVLLLAYDAFAERMRKLDGKALVDGMDEGGFDIVVVKPPRHVTMVSGDAARGFVRVVRSDELQVVSDPPSADCKLTDAAKELCDTSTGEGTECYFADAGE